MEYYWWPDFRNSWVADGGGFVEFPGI